MRLLAILLHDGLTFGLGFASAIFAEPLRRWVFRPKLHITFDQLPQCNVKLGNGLTVLRLRVVNKSRWPARKCQAYLAEVRMPGSTPNQSLILDEARPLHWAFSAEQADLHSKMAQYVDLAEVGENRELAFSTVIPGRLRNAHRSSARFICRVVVASEEGSHAEATFQLVRNHPTADFVFVDAALA